MVTYGPLCTKFQQNSNSINIFFGVLYCSQFFIVQNLSYFSTFLFVLIHIHTSTDFMLSKFVGCCRRTTMMMLMVSMPIMLLLPSLLPLMFLLAFCCYCYYFCCHCLPIIDVAIFAFVWRRCALLFWPGPNDWNLLVTVTITVLCLLLFSLLRRRMCFGCRCDAMLLYTYIHTYAKHKTAVTLQFVSHNFLDYHDPTIGK